MSKILVVDDEKGIRDLVAKYARFESHEVDEAENGFIALKMLRENSYDLVVMDIMMPELDGFSTVKELRKFSDIPVILLSARGEEYDKLYGFELGIDDYVTKPFSPRELLMRINAILARYNLPKEKEAHEVFSLDSMQIDFNAYTVIIDGKNVDLTPKEYELLVYLIRNEGIAVTRERLLEKIWGYDYFGDDRTLDTHMKSLRKKIGKYGDHIITIRRVGYRFEK